MASIKHLLHVTASKEKVYEAISTINGLANWWTKQTTGESKVGGIIQFRFTDAGCDMKVTSLKDNECISWECIAGFPEWIGTKISIRLEETNGKTKVQFEHSDWKETNEFYAGCSFSWGRFMESLRQLCQTGEGEAFGSKNYRQ
jgi:uncharacterized protein YndB with AHSA1/START domain